MSQSVLTLERVSKRYAHFELRAISLELEAGRTLALVGPNGSGKSTLLRLILGLVHQDTGAVRVFGWPMPASQARVKAQVGFVSDDLRLHRAATLRWHAELVRSLCPRWDEERALRLSERFDLPWKQPVGGFSRGQVAKALLVLALARRPGLLLLDEPTASLDAASRAEWLRELHRLGQTEGLAILAASHNPADFAGSAVGFLHLPEGRLECARPSVPGRPTVLRSAGVAESGSYHQNQTGPAMEAGPQGPPGGS